MLNLLGGTVNGLSAFLITYIVARSVGAEKSAGFFEVVALFSILTVIGQLGAGPGLLRAVASARAAGDVRMLRRVVRTAVIGVALVSSTLALGFELLAPWLADRLDPSKAGHLELLLEISLPCLPAACLGGVLFAATRGFGTMAPSVWFDSVAKPSLRTLAVLAMTVLGAGVLAITAAWAAVVPIAAIASIICVRRMLSEFSPSAPSIVMPTDQSVAAFWRFSSLQVFSEFFQVGVQWLDVLLLGWLATSTEVGIYAAVSRLLFVGLMGAVAVAQVLAPRVAELLARKETRPAEATYQTATFGLVAVTFPIYLIMAVFPETFVHAFGTNFSAGAGPLTILSLAMLANVGTGPVLVVLVMGGRSDLGMVDSAIALAANVGLNLLLIPRFGMTGAAVAWAASIVLMNGLPLLQVRRVWAMTPFTPTYWKIVTASAGCFGVAPLVARFTLGTSAGIAVPVSLVATSAYAVVLVRIGVVRTAREAISRALPAESLEVGTPLS